ncbi:MAG: SpoIVB peptidase [Clostridia bacterium]|nr:SpoIVB peptidase [Clostridia bacterium]
MRNTISGKKRLIIFTCLITGLIISLIAECNFKYPDRIQIFEGETFHSETSSPYTIGVPAAFGGVLEEDGNVRKEESTIGLSKTRSPENRFEAQLRLFGIIPVRSIEVDVRSPMELVPCGNAIGIKIFTEGLVCVGVSELLDENGNRVNPSHEYGIESGDILLSANGTTLSTTEQLAELVENSEKNAITLTVSRGGKHIDRTVVPTQTEDGPKLGLWVRDSTAGIGTLTFYDEDSGSFGALGHPISDTDSGTLMPVHSGSITRAGVYQIKKGARGEPGELKGMFYGSENDLGRIEKNTSKGIFGTLNPEELNLSGESIPVASSSQIKEGKAKILSSIDEDGVKEYEVEIQRVLKYGNSGGKDMVICVTDPELLKKTGGIVQGMSGSPIIQEGKLVGAVTHVFVNDPTRGYGIFIENMLSETERK